MRNPQKTFFLLVVFFFGTELICAQRSFPVVEMLASGTKTSLRGLSVVNDNVVWVSGSNGTVGKTTNGGKNWKWYNVKGFEKREFRDIEAFDATTALIIAVDEPGYILKTSDGGESWKVVYENKTKGMFMDAMDFWDERSGTVVGDPVNGRFFITRSSDGGNTWQDELLENCPRADSGEACFASSGTNIRALDEHKTVFVSGGRRSRVFMASSAIDLPITQGKESTGANSIAVYNPYRGSGGKRMIVVGGDFTSDSSHQKNCFFTDDGGKTWLAPKIPPHGYRSCVEYLSKKDIVTCGLNGVDYSLDGGRTFTWISKEGFHVCRIAKFGPSIFLAGGNGRVAKLMWNQ